MTCAGNDNAYKVQASGPHGACLSFFFGSLTHDWHLRKDQLVAWTVRCRTREAVSPLTRTRVGEAV